MVGDFTSDFDGSLKAAFGALMAATKAANRLPNDISFHRTLDEAIDSRLERSGRKALGMANRLWTKSRNSAADAEIESIDDIAIRTSSGTWEAAPGFRTVVDAVDTLLEKIDVGLDEVLRRPAHNMRVTASVGKQSAPIMTSVNMGNGDVRLVHANNVARPQLSFKDVVDNSGSTPFVWKIREKPNALVPLEYGLPGVDTKGTPLGDHLASMGMRSGNSMGKGEASDEVHLDMPHPYEYEIKHQPTATQLFEEKPATSPKEWDNTPFEFVDTEEQLTEMMEHLRAANEIAIDLEHHNYRSYQGFTCLVQISTRCRDYVVDALALRSSLHVLNQVTSDPKKVKVLHGAESDVVWLQRDFGVYLVGLFDTYHASHVLNMPHHSLAHLLKTYCQYDADKKYQLADWRIRPIPAEMMHYARADTHFLLYVYDCMRNELLSRGRELVGHDVGTPGAKYFGRLAGIDTVTTAAQPMELVVQRSNATALNRYVKETYDADHGLGAGGWASLLRKWRSPFTPVQLQVFRAVHQWRDACAREEDESSRYVLPNHMLFAIADRMPTDVPQLLAACQPTPPLLRLYATDVVRMVNVAKMAAEKRMKEFADIVSTAHEESVPDRPVHTRFDDDDHQKSVGEDVEMEMEMEEANVPDVLTPAMLASAKELMAPRSALFGILKDWKKKKNMEVSEASLKAQEIRKNLVLTVAAPVAVISDSVVVEQKAEEKQERVQDLDQDQDQDQKPVQPVVLSETYARYQPEAPRQIKKQKTDDLPRLSTINLDDISDSSDNNDNNNTGGKRGKKRDRKKTTAAGGGIAPDDVKPYEYDAAEDDVLGESTTQGASKKHKRKAAASRGQQSFNPYGQIETTRELAKRPPRSRVQTKQGNKTMTFKK